MGKDIRKSLENCKDCILHGRVNRAEPMYRKELPVGAWMKIAIDFHGTHNGR